MDFNNIEDIREFLKNVEQTYSEDRDYISQSSLVLNEFGHHNLLKCIDKLVTMDVKYFEEFKDHPFWKKYKSSNTKSHYIVTLMKRDIDNPWNKKILSLLKDNRSYNTVFTKGKINIKFLDKILNDDKNDYKYINFLKENTNFKIEESEDNYNMNLYFLSKGTIKYIKFFWDQNLYLNVFNNKRILDNFTHQLIYNNKRDPIAKLKNIPKAIFNDNFLISLHSAFNNVYSDIFVYKPNTRNSINIKKYLLNMEGELIKKNLKDVLKTNILNNLSRIDFYNCKNTDFVKEYLVINFEKDVFNRDDIPKIIKSLTGLGRYTLIKLEELEDMCFNVEMKKELLEEKEFRSINKRKI